MINLNSNNGADKILLDVANNVLDEFEGNITGAEFGVAYGGGVEAIGKLWKNRGVIYGFDTFEGHPKFLAKKDIYCNYDENAFVANCMNQWYELYGTEFLKINYIQNELNNQNLNNVILKKGLIDETSNIDFIDILHYTFLDFDFPISMANAYNLVKNKIVKNGYICMHDVIPHGHIDGLYEFYQKVLLDNYEVINHCEDSQLVVLKKL